MIEAQHTKWAEKIFSIYIHRLLRKNFYSINIIGDIPEINQEYPIFLTPNHSTWWDGFFIFMLNEKIFNRVGYLMMLEEQLSKFKFFSRLGVYSINPNSTKSLVESMKYTLKILQKNSPTKLLFCIFPQGQLTPNRKRPIQFKPGIDWLIKKYEKSINLIPLAIQIEFLDNQLPEVFLSFKHNFIVNKHNFGGISWLEKRQEELMNDLNGRIINGEKGNSIFTGKKSVSDKYENFRATIKQVR